MRIVEGRHATVAAMPSHEADRSAGVEAFVSGNRPALIGWIRDARAMLAGTGTARSAGDLSMLATMLERTSASMLPACAMAHLVRRETDGGNPYGDGTAAQDRTTGIVADVMRAADRLDTARSTGPEDMDAICTMAASVVIGAMSYAT